MFHAFLIANGGNGIVTEDGKPHLDDPQVKEAVIKSITYIAHAYKDGYVPPGALSWNDADDNNAFHSKLMVMDFDGTISTEVALYHDKDGNTTTSRPSACRRATTASRMRRSSGSAAPSSQRGRKTSKSPRTS